MRKKNKIAIPWNEIDTVILDMDGTLIDQHHEDYFWLELVPQAYAKKHDISIEHAKDKVFRMYAKKEGTIAWYDVDLWGKDLDINIRLIRREIVHLLKLHPHTLRFLKFLKKQKKKIYLVTGAPVKDMRFETNYTGIGKYLDGMYSHSKIGKPKNDKLFWEHIQKIIGYDKTRTLIADDAQNILKAAKSHGIKWLVLKAKASSKKPAVHSPDFISVHHLDDIIPSRQKSR